MLLHKLNYIICIKRNVRLSAIVIKYMLIFVSVANFSRITAIQ